MFRGFRQQRAGFTFIEVLIAILIFTMVVVSAIGVVRGSVRATQESKEISAAAWLLQGKMVELETNIETLGPDKACEKKKTGKFPAPNEKFSWVTTCDQIDFKLPEAATLTAGMNKNKDDSDDSNSTQENEIAKMIFTAASDYMTKSLRELHAEIIWMQGKTQRHVSATTEWARYDQAMNLPGLGVSPGTGSPGVPQGTGGTGGSPGGGTNGTGTGSPFPTQ